VTFAEKWRLGEIVGPDENEHQNRGFRSDQGVNSSILWNGVGGILKKIV
jgi:hypothetical protein